MRRGELGVVPVIRLLVASRGGREQDSPEGRAQEAREDRERPQGATNEGPDCGDRRGRRLHRTAADEIDAVLLFLVVRQADESYEFPSAVSSSGAAAACPLGPAEGRSPHQPNFEIPFLRKYIF